MADVNLARKRRISIMIGAQTKRQFHMIYGSEGTQALFIGLATQVVYGGCAADTAEFYSKASGTATQESSSDDKHSRSRPLLTLDEVITPQVGNCTIFARYVEAGFATQVILNVRLTHFYEREDWKQRLSAAKDIQPLLLERGISLDLKSVEPIEPSAPDPKPTLELAASALMARVAADALRQTGGKTQMTSLMEWGTRRHQVDQDIEVERQGGHHSVEPLLQ